MLQIVKILFNNLVTTYNDIIIVLTDYYVLFY